MSRGTALLVTLFFAIWCLKGPPLSARAENQALTFLRFGVAYPATMGAFDNKSIPVVTRFIGRAFHTQTLVGSPRFPWAAVGRLVTPMSFPMKERLLQGDHKERSDLFPTEHFRHLGLIAES